MRKKELKNIDEDYTAGYNLFRKEVLELLKKQKIKEKGLNQKEFNYGLGWNDALAQIKEFAQT